MVTEVHSVAFNQDFGCFVCATNKGFRVYNTDPFKETFCRTFGRGGANRGVGGNNGGNGGSGNDRGGCYETATGGGGLASVEMLFRCNILALVGGGPDPAWPPLKVVVWDDHAGRAAGELSFRSPVRAVRLRRDAVVVALEHRVLVYAFGDLSLRHSAETLSNPRGLVAVSAQPGALVLACPGLHAGQVRLEHLDRRQTRFVAAHTGSLAALALSLDGKRLATASDRGTLVRVWSTGDGALLQELRRGSDPACVGSLAMSAGLEWLAAASDKGTVHVWALAAAVRGAGDAGDGRREHGQQQQQQHRRAGVRQGVAAAAAEGDAGGRGVYGQYGSGDVAGLGAGRARGAAGSGGAAERAAGGSHPGSSPSLLAAAAGSPGGSGGGGGGGGNPTTVLSSVRGIAPILPRYFSSEWSLAQYRVPEPDAGAIVIGFPPPPASAAAPSAGGAAAAPPAAAAPLALPAQPCLVVLTASGSYHKVTFDPVKGGPCVPVAVGRYIVDFDD